MKEADPSGIFRRTTALVYFTDMPMAQKCLAVGLVIVFVILFSGFLLSLLSRGDFRRMPIDPYAACPGGTGKKIKFCCTELVSDLEQLDRLIEGDQISAALEQVERLSQRTPNRACLMAMRVKLELGSRKFAAAAASSRAFLSAFPDNPLALGHAAVADAIAGRLQEAAALFDKARETAGADVSPDMINIAATLVQASAQAGHVGCAQGIVEWMIDKSLSTPEDRRLLASIVGSSGVPPALRTKVRLADTLENSPGKKEFDAALHAARSWKLSAALAMFRSLQKSTGESRPLFTNIALLCEMLARPFEASEAWLAVARLPNVPYDDAVEATGRAIALETEADEDRSPQVPFERAKAPLAATEAGSIELLEDTLRHNALFDTSPFERSEWVSRGAVPPRSAWRVYEPPAIPGKASQLLALLLIFGRQTDREPEVVLQGFAPDVARAKRIVEPLLHVSFAAESEREGMPSTTPTNWLLSAQFRMPPPENLKEGTLPGEASVFERMFHEQQAAAWARFRAVWPDTPLPELLGRSPREALKQPEGAWRVESLLSEGEATSRRRDAADAWAAMRLQLGVAVPAAIESITPMQDVPPMRWHRVSLGSLALDQLRGIFMTAVDAGFDLAAERAAEAIVARADAAPVDRMEAWSLLEDRAESSVRKLEIIQELRALATTLKASDGMIDVAELRIRLQRGDQADIMRLLDHLRRDHSRDQKVLESLAAVLSEAGIDLSSFAGQAQGGGVPALGAAGTSDAAQPTGSAIWTPGGSQQPGPQGEKKAIWTP